MQSNHHPIAAADPPNPFAGPSDRRQSDFHTTTLELELARARERIIELTCERDDLCRDITRLTELAWTDELTGLGNRRRFGEALETAFALMSERDVPLSLIILDIDRFKAYNDAFGHTAGDRVLCLFAQQLLETCRGDDVVARYGGEEFAVLLPAAGLEVALACAERQRAAIASFDWPHRQVTASFGVATLGRSALDPSELVEQADSALYRSKRRGRNRVTCHEDKYEHERVSEAFTPDGIRRRHTHAALHGPSESPEGTDRPARSDVSGGISS